MSEAAAQPRRRGGRGRALVALLLLAIFAGAWTGLYGVFELGEDEHALISRAGRVVKQVAGPGRFVHWPFPLERRAIVSRSPQATAGIEVALVTRDAQLVDGALRSKYRVTDPLAARFGVRDPVGVIEAIVGRSAVAIVATQDHATLESSAPGSLDARILNYANDRLSILNLGLEVVDAELGLEMPESIAALEAEIAALEGERNSEVAAAGREAEARLSEARVRALEETQRAQSERDTRIAQATGEAERFRVVAAEYLKAPELVKTRIYLETMEEILGNARVVIAAPGAPVPPPPPTTVSPPVSAGAPAGVEQERLP